ncbi:hypothetical protein [uncultured Shewanella sp.]|uniref:hypothetical protein n=1 Tax=uncultured Shewanella sp. TaxID=173975 RepID=UPI002603C7D2|nr:hypothetical protein [uncultured Shewanella sp.]
MYIEETVRFVVLLITFLIAFIICVGSELYNDYQYRQEMNYKIEMEKAAERKRQAPSSSCIDGHYRVTDYSNSMAVSIPVWTDEGVIECDGDNYHINRRVISNQELNQYKSSAVMQNRGSTEHNQCGGMAVIDASAIALMQKNVVQ